MQWEGGLLCLKRGNYRCFAMNVIWGKVTGTQLIGEKNDSNNQKGRHKVHGETRTDKLGHKGELIVTTALKRIYKADVVKDVPRDIDLQLKYGDILVVGCADIGIPHTKIEVKTEHTHTGNLFWELWSDKPTNRKGWGVTSNADQLYYLFWDDGIGYKIHDLSKLKWLVDYYKNDFRLIEQKKTNQANETWGYLVPVNWALETTYVDKFDFNKLKGEAE